MKANIHIRELVLLGVGAASLLWGQIDTQKVWKVEGMLGLQAAQTALSNWQAGGQNQTSLGTQQRLFVLRGYGVHTLSIEYTGQYGLLRVVPQRTWRKTQDFLLLVLQYKRKFASKWAFSVLSDGRTQWAPTYAYVGDSAIRPAKSAFMAPFYGQFSLGVLYMPVKVWQLTFSPVSGRVTYVRLGYLADAGEFGLTPAEKDSLGNIIRPARKALWEVGGRITSRLNITPVKQLSINHFLDAFYGYLPQRLNPIIVSQLQIAYNLKSWLAISLSQQAIYDPRIGDRENALQLLTAWTLGLTWRSTYPKG
ncbi:MAG: DUF3078 domain-containing protein [Bacteroidia bacterium]|nr:DUF3078 domain-containing protein [Bacteroidia bacterium]MCX7652828.1 DUF3078 domain-containing protein [Bacteroidia bacterium]MDW8415936.1 DUF3078 domain-containing protein [Bacteroidia bacterium]